MPTPTSSFRNTTQVVFNKELRESLRDRRSLFSALLTPLLGAGLLFMSIQQLAKLSDEETEAVCHVQGAEHAPHLSEALRLAHIKLEPVTASQAQAFRNHDEDLLPQDPKMLALLEIPEDFDASLARAEPAKLNLYGDLSNRQTAKLVARTGSVIRRYAARLGSQRLIARGVSPSVTRAIVAHEVDLATPAQSASLLTNIMLTFAIMSTAIGGMYVAIDCTAGERERRSLEPLLSTPISNLALCLGKLLATWTLSAATTALTVLLMSVTLSLAPLEALGMSFQLSNFDMLGIIAVLLPLGLLMSVAQLLLATFARSYREAQTYLTTLLVLPILPGLLYDSSQQAPARWMHAIPGLGQHLQSTSILRGETVDPSDLLLSTLTCLLVSVALLAAWSRVTRQERIIYGR